MKTTGWIREITTTAGKSYNQDEEYEIEKGGEVSQIWSQRIDEEGNAWVAFFPANKWQSRNKELNELFIPAHQIKKVVITRSLTDYERTEWKEMEGDETCEANAEAQEEQK